MTCDPGLCALTVSSWAGELPIPGQYVKARRGRTAFRIVEIRLPKRAGTRYVARLFCERRPAAALSAEDVVHCWEWASRG